MIFTTAYTSRTTRTWSADDLTQLLDECRVRNAEHGITGLLMYRDGRIFQILEGSHDAVRHLYDRIVLDVRHHQVVNVWVGRASQRRFPDWTMGYEDLADPGDDVPTDWSIDPSILMTPGIDLTSADLEPLDREEPAAYVRRRAAALRLGLNTGDRLIATLAIILNGHDPEVADDRHGAPAVVHDDSSARPGHAGSAGHYIRCRVCRPSGDPVLDRYPCPTAQNAIWALESRQR